MTASNSEQAHCQKCGASIIFDPSVGALRCAHCGDLRLIMPTQFLARVERSVEDGIVAEINGGGLGVATRVSSCDACGAKVEWPGESIVLTCDFCGSDNIQTEPVTALGMKPQAIVPFALDKEHAMRLYLGWAGRSWFRPGDFTKSSALADIRGVYIPHWTFDAIAHTEWSAESGEYYYETKHYTERGADGKAHHRTRRVQHTRWSPASGRRDDIFNDELVVASRNMPQIATDSVREFDVSAAVDYDPRYLAGMRAERHSILLAMAWPAAQNRFASRARKNASGDVPGDTQRGLQTTTTYSRCTFRYVLLPMWLATTRYRGKAYSFVVNGQSGKVAGEVPTSAARVATGASACVALVVGLLLALTRNSAQPVRPPVSAYDYAPVLSAPAIESPPPPPRDPEQMRFEAMSDDEHLAAARTLLHEIPRADDPTNTMLDMLDAHLDEAIQDAAYARDAEGLLREAAALRRRFPAVIATAAKRRRDVFARELHDRLLEMRVRVRSVAATGRNGTVLRIRASSCSVPALRALLAPDSDRSSVEELGFVDVQCARAR